MTLECVHNNNIAVFVVQYNYVVGPMARPGARGLGPAWASNMTIVLRAGPGLDILFAGRAGSGPHNSVFGPGQVCTTTAGPGRAWASNHICGPGLGLNFRPVQGPSRQGRQSLGAPESSMWTRTEHAFSYAYLSHVKSTECQPNDP